jgi:mycothiol synthase
VNCPTTVPYPLSPAAANMSAVSCALAPERAAGAMAITTYYKRYRMEAALDDLPPVPALPSGLGWAPWDESWLEAHAQVKWRAFRGEIDSAVFPNLARLDGCRNLMRVIRSKSDFCPRATWLITGPDGGCGTVQGLRDDSGAGSIQNLGVVPEWRGLGLGRALMLRALHGFWASGLEKAMLEVTAKNTSAVRLYHGLGFAIVKTLYREVQVAEPEEEVFVI